MVLPYGKYWCRGGERRWAAAAATTAVVVVVVLLLLLVEAAVVLVLVVVIVMSVADEPSGPRWCPLRSAESVRSTRRHRQDR
jgi:hypothetical protein